MFDYGTQIVSRVNLIPIGSTAPRSGFLSGAGIRAVFAPAPQSNTDAQGPAPGGASGGAAPPSPSAGMPNLSPTLRTLAKVLPFAAAVYFLSKGDTGLGIAAAGAGAAALVML